MLTAIIMAMLSVSPSPSHTMHFGHPGQSVKHRDCAADHPDRFTASERTPTATVKKF